MEIRNYNPDTDKKATIRIWKEVGWLDTSEKEHVEAFDRLLAGGRAMVATLNNDPECLVSSLSGSLRYLDSDIPFTAITGVTTSFIGRKQGLASRATSSLIAHDVADGAMIAWLGVFDQGYYDRLGFGTAPYDHHVRFEPRQLTVDIPKRTICRLGKDDWNEIHNCRLNRQLHHGYMSITSSASTRADMVWEKNGVGLGYRDEQGKLTHHIWMTKHDPEEGPFDIQWLAYQTPQQFIELLGIIKTLEEQVLVVEMREPAKTQLQDYLTIPMARSRSTRGSKHWTGITATAYNQGRICDIVGCLEKTHLNCLDLTFNLALTDPIEKYLDDTQPWRGLTGNYIITLGKSCHAEIGHNEKLPTLNATINAFTRMWLGTLPATSLATNLGLSTNDQQLLNALDNAFNIPLPNWNWTF